VNLGPERPRYAADLERHSIRMLAFLMIVP